MSPLVTDSIQGEKTPLSPYVKKVIVLLCVATLFEGFDFYAINLLVGSLQKEFKVTQDYLFTGLGFLNVGMILAFFVVRAADRWGRKPMLLLCVAVYGLMSLATWFSPTLELFWALQFVSKIFLVAEYGLASLIVGEEIPAERRGMGIALVQLSAGIGAILAAITAKFILPSELGWRGIYLVGSLPLLLLIPLALSLKETSFFVTMQNSGQNLQQNLFAIWKSPNSKWITPLGAMWFLCYLCLAGMITTFPFYAEKELGLEPTQFLGKLALASVIGMVGYVVSGAMMDKIGRKKTAVFFFVLGSLSVLWAFHAPVSQLGISLIAANFFILPLMPICATLSAEMFPTLERASGNAWSHYLIGRWAYILAPVAIGWMANPARLGSFSQSVSIMAAGPIIAAIIVFLVLPERKGLSLDALDGEK